MLVLKGDNFMDNQNDDEYIHKKFISAESFRQVFKISGLTTNQIYQNILLDPDFKDYNSFLDKEHYKEFLKYKKYVYEILKVDKNGNPAFPKPNHLIFKRITGAILMVIGLPFKLFSYVYLFAKIFSNVTFFLRLFCNLFMAIIPMIYGYIVIRGSAIENYDGNVTFSNMFKYADYTYVAKDYIVFLFIFSILVHFLGNLFLYRPCDEFDVSRDDSFYHLGYIFHKGIFYYGFLLLNPISYENHVEEINYKVNCYSTKLSRFFSKNKIFNNAIYMDPNILYEDCKQFLPYLSYIPEFDENGYDQYGLNRQRRNRSGEQM